MACLHGAGTQVLRFWDVGVDVEDSAGVQSVGYSALTKQGPVASLVFQFDIREKPLDFGDEKAVPCFVNIA